MDYKYQATHVRVRIGALTKNDIAQICNKIAAHQAFAGTNADPQPCPISEGGIALLSHYVALPDGSEIWKDIRFPVNERDASNTLHWPWISKNDTRSSWLGCTYIVCHYKANPTPWSQARSPGDKLYPVYITLRSHDRKKNPTGNIWTPGQIEAIKEIFAEQCVADRSTSRDRWYDNDDGDLRLPS